VKRVLALSAILFLLLIPAVCHATQSTTGMPNEAQSLARMLWGSFAMDFWTATCTVKDTLGVTFLFVNPDSSDTLLVDPSAVLFASSVACTVQCSGDSALWIDRAKMPVEAGEALLLPARVQRISVIMSGAGRARTWALGD